MDGTIYELPYSPKLELGDGLLDLIGVEADDILEQTVINKKQQEHAIFKQIKEDYNFDETKDAFDEGVVPHQLDFSMVEKIVTSIKQFNFFLPTNENREFIAFLQSDQGQNLITNNILSIHIESGDIFYQNLNTGKVFYNFILAQQDHQTAPVPKRFS